MIRSQGNTRESRLPHIYTISPPSFGILLLSNFSAFFAAAMQVSYPS